MAADPVHCGGQAMPVRTSAFLRHISIMHLLSLGYEASGSGLRRLGRSPSCHLTSARTWAAIVYGGPRLLRLSRARRVSFTDWFTGVRGPRAGAGKIRPHQRTNLDGTGRKKPRERKGDEGYATAGRA
jgi:hypothetical protein